MNKKFFKTATLTMVATTALAVLFSYIYVFVGFKIASGDPMMGFLSTLETIFDFVQLSVGFATVVYAFAKFDFNNALKVFGVFCITVFSYGIIVMVPTGIYINTLDYAVTHYSYEFNAYINTIFFSFGNVLICQIAPAMIMCAIMWKCTKDRKPAPRKIISWKNPTQKGMIISCLSLALFNFIVRCLSDYSILGILLEERFHTTWESFVQILLALLSTFLNCVVFNIILMYFVCLFAYKIYDYISSTPVKEKVKSVETENISSNEETTQSTKNKTSNKKK